MTRPITVLVLLLGTAAWAGGDKAMPQKWMPQRSPWRPLLRNVPDGIVVDSRTSRVEVYPGTALIERVATVDLEPGERRLVVPALPDTLNPSTLHISGFGKDAVAGSTFLEAGTLVEARPKELVEIEDALKAFEGQDRFLSGQESAQRQRRDLLVANVSRLSSSPPALTVEGLAKALDYAQKELLAIDGELARLDNERRELTPQLEGLRKEHEELRSRLERPVKHVVVEVTVRAKVRLPLVLRYFVDGPTWKPRHVGRFDPGSGKLGLESYAWVVQGTGEDWKDVELRVSSSRPAAGLLPPSGAALEVHLDKGSGQVAGEARGLGETADAASGMAAIGQRQWSIPGRVTVESGKKGRRVLLEAITTEVEAERVAAPRLSPGVYLRLSFRNPLMSPLLPGEAALFNGPDYVGTASLPAVMPGEALSLPCGRDPLVDVTRSRVARQAESSARGQTVRYRYSYQATSRIRRPITVEVREQIPVAHVPGIKVTQEPGQLAPTVAREGAPGTVLWRVELPPAGQRQWDHGYTIAAPAGRRLLGVD